MVDVCRFGKRRSQDAQVPEGSLSEGRRRPRDTESGPRSTTYQLTAADEDRKSSYRSRRLNIIAVFFLGILEQRRDRHGARQGKLLTSRTTTASN
jgi:hypothetical protein